MRRRAREDAGATTGPAPGPAPSGPAVSGQAAALLRIQRVAGNAAANALLQREPSGGAALGAYDQSEKSKAYTPKGLLGTTLEAPEDGSKKKVVPIPGRAQKQFDPAKAEADLVELEKRLARFPAIAQSPFMGHMRRYVAAAAKQLTPPGDPAAEAVAMSEMNAAISVLQGLQAFHIGNEVYAKVGEKPDRDQLRALAETAMQGTHLWSKLNKYKAIDTVAGGRRGNSLEASAAGSLFDDLGFGMDYHTKAHTVLKQQWEIVSASFVRQARGIVHAQVLEGIDPDSVLTKTEWPIIRDLMKEGLVAAFVVHIFEWDEKAGLVEIGQRTIHHPNEWMGLPSVTEWNEGAQDYSSTHVFDEATGQQKYGSAYAKRQNDAQDGENARHAAAEEAKKQPAADPRAQQRASFRQAMARFVELDVYS